MRAIFSSQRTPTSSGKSSRYSLKCLTASREPAGFVCTAAGCDGNDARAFAAAGDAIVVLAASHRRDALNEDECRERMSAPSVGSVSTLARSREIVS